MSFTEIERINENLLFYNQNTQLKNYVYRKSKEMFDYGDSCRDLILTIDDLENRKGFMRTKFIDTIGGLPKSTTSLMPEIKGIIHENGFRIEKVIFQSRPKTFVTANLYIPDSIVSPVGAVLFLCGHHMFGKHQDEYQIVCRYLVKAGLIVLAQDPIGQGERFSYYDKATASTTIDWGVREHDYAGIQSLMLGDGIARYFLHDAMRGIDYLSSRPEVDPLKIGVTGNSGGGLQTSMMMICDARIAAAAPATFITNRETVIDSGQPQDSEQIWKGMSTLGFDHEDIILMMAPKPVLINAAKYDFFPIEGTRRTYKRTKRFWTMYAKDDCFEFFEDTSVHKYTRRMARKAAEFFSQHLLGKMISPDDSEIESIEPATLWCTISGQICADKPEARTVYDENCIRLNVVDTNKKDTKDDILRDKAIQWLKDTVFFSRNSCGINTRHIAEVINENLSCLLSKWWSQQGMMNNALTFRDTRYIGAKLPVTIAMWDGGTRRIQPNVEWIREVCIKGRMVVVLDISGVGMSEPDSINPIPKFEPLGTLHKLTCDLFWLDDSLAALRTFDVLRAVDAIIETFDFVDTSDIELYGIGRYSLYALLAGLLDGRITKVKTKDGITSFRNLVLSKYYDDYDIMCSIIPNILNYCDLPEIRRWLGRKYSD